MRKDYGYFGKGSTGYAQYMTAYKRNYSYSQHRRLENQFWRGLSNIIAIVIIPVLLFSAIVFIGGGIGSLIIPTRPGDIVSDSQVLTGAIVFFAFVYLYFYSKGGPESEREERIVCAKWKAGCILLGCLAIMAYNAFQMRAPFFECKEKARQICANAGVTVEKIEIRTDDSSGLERYRLYIVASCDESKLRENDVQQLVTELCRMDNMELTFTPLGDTFTECLEKEITLNGRVFRTEQYGTSVYLKDNGRHVRIVKS